MNPLIRPWRHLFDFNGRATRTEYLLFHITGIAALFVLGMVLGLIAAMIGDTRSDGPNPAAAIVMIPLLIGYLVFVVTHIAIGVRRLHDHGEPGIKYLLTFIPLVGIFFLLMMIFTAGHDFENDYGPDPRQPDQGTGDELGGVFS